MARRRETATLSLTALLCVENLSSAPSLSAHPCPGSTPAPAPPQPSSHLHTGSGRTMPRAAVRTHVHGRPWTRTAAQSDSPDPSR